MAPPPERSVESVVPLYGLTISTDRLQLRLTRSQDLPALAAAAQAGLHDSDQHPFLNPFGSAQTAWSEADPAERAHSVVLKQFRAIGNWRPDNWSLELGVWVGDEVVGVQGLHARHFAITGEVSTTSWLTLSHHGKGIGTHMREAVLSFAFSSLEAATARSRAFVKNPASNKVSQKLGYRLDGLDIEACADGVAHWSQTYRMSSADWEATERPVVQVAGFEACRDWFGLPNPTAIPS